jgi:hypothetical protein
MKVFEKSSGTQISVKMNSKLSVEMKSALIFGLNLSLQGGSIREWKFIDRSSALKTSENTRIDLKISLGLISSYLIRIKQRSLF